MNAESDGAEGDGDERPAASVGAIFRRILGNAGKLLGGRAVNAVVSLGYTAVTARALGVDGLGVLVMINAFAQLLGDVVKFQSWQTVLQYGAEPLAHRRLDDLQRVVRFTMLLDIASGVIGVIVGVAGALIFGPQLGWTAAQAPLAAAYAASAFFMTAAAPLGVLRLLDRFDVLATNAAVISLVRLAGCGLGFALHADLAFFLLVWALGTIAGYVQLLVVAVREMRRQDLLHGFRWFGPVQIRAEGVWRFAWATNLNATVGVAFTHLVTLIVGGLLGPSEAALWRVGRQVADAIAKPVRLLTPALYPELVRLMVEGREHEMWRLTGRIALTASGVGLLLLAVSGFAGAPLLQLVMGPGFAAAAGIMTWQVAAAVINLISLPLEPMVITLGKAGATVWVRVAAAVVYIAALPFLVPRYGLTAAGAGLVASTAAIALGMFWLLMQQRAEGRGGKSLDHPPRLGETGAVNVTPTAPNRAIRCGDFATLTEALDFAATGETGLNFHDVRGKLILALPYGDLREQALEFARGLLAAGLSPGDRVGLIADTTPDFVRAFFACQYAGLVPAPMPLPTPLGGREAYVAQIARMLSAAAASAVIAPVEFEAWAEDAAGASGVARTLRLADLPAGADQALPQISPEQTSYLQFSSGSTRTPAGVVVTHRALMANALAITRDGLQITAADRAVSWLPLYHDMGLIGFLLSPLASQMTVDLLPTAAFVRRPLLWLDLIARHGGTVSYSPTFGYDLCARRGDAASEVDLSRWRIAGVGGDMVRAGPLEAFAERFAAAGFQRSAFVASYGMAEATLALTMAPLDQGLRADTVDVDLMERDGTVAAGEAAERRRSFVRCGPILPGHELQVRDEAGQVLPERRVGRIYVRGPSLMREYFRQPEATAAVLSADGWLDTGDLGYVADGEITPTGRSKDLILLNGRNIWPQDLEWTAESGVEGLRSGDVAAIALGESEETVMLLVQCRSSDPEVRQRISEGTAALMRARHGVDAQVRLVGSRALPQTSSGKLSRSKARALFESGAFDLLES